MSQTERTKNSKDVVEEYWSTGEKCHKYLLALETFNLLFPPWKWLGTPRQFEPLCFMPDSAKCPDFRGHDNRESCRRWLQLGRLSVTLIHNHNFQLVNCLGRYFTKWIRKHGEKEFSLECHILLELLSSWLNPNIFFLPTLTVCFPEFRIINLQHIQQKLCIGTITDARAMILKVHSHPDELPPGVDRWRWRGGGIKASWVNGFIKLQGGRKVCRNENQGFLDTSNMAVSL